MYVVFFFFFVFLYLSDCAASPTFNRFAILSFCLKPLHSHRALHVCSHDNLSSPRSSFLLPLSPLSRATGEKGEDVRKASVASCLGLTQGRVDSFVIGSAVRTGRRASDVTGTQSKNLSELYLFTVGTAGVTNAQLQRTISPLREEVFPDFEKWGVLLYV